MREMRKISFILGVWLGCLCFMLMGTPAGAIPIERVSIFDDGVNFAEGDGQSTGVGVSADGAVVAFSSLATTLVGPGGDTNGFADVFVRQRFLFTTLLVSVSSAEAQGNGHSSTARMSADGNIVAFTSEADNLVADDTNGVTDIFVRDIASGTTIRVSVGTGNVQANGQSLNPAISADGRYVAFASEATNLVADDTNGFFDIFVYDLTNDTTARVSLAPGGVQANGHSSSPSLSADGSLVSFDSGASNLVTGDTNGQTDVFVRDIPNDVVNRASVVGQNTTLIEGNGESSHSAISPDGRYVAFSSLATNLEAGDGPALPIEKDYFLYDVQNDVTTWFASQGDGPMEPDPPSFSGNGRFVAFHSHAVLVAGDANNRHDVYVYDTVTQGFQRVSETSAGAEAPLGGILPVFSANGHRVVFTSQDGTLVIGDTNNTFDAFMIFRNAGPIADAGATPAQVISVNETNAVYPLDGSLSTDPEDDPLTYTWYADGNLVTPIATGVTASATLSVGAHTITLVVADSFGASDTTTIAVTVDTLGQATGALIDAVETAPISDTTENELVSILESADAAFAHGNLKTGVNKLHAFQNKVSAQTDKSIPLATAIQLISDAQVIIDAVNLAQ
ncbi:MAG: hypothetical protein ACYC7E_19230 [Armatimonadota bacterium]